MDGECREAVAGAKTAARYTPAGWRRPTTNTFVYGIRLAPDRLAEVVPGARFVAVAHLPETRLVFTIDRPELGGGLPSVEPAPGNTVWGAVFEIPDTEAPRLDEVEAAEGRRRVDGFRAVDRDGTPYEVWTHVAAGGGTETSPSPDHLGTLVAGARHWGLPAGWIIGLEELGSDPVG